MKTINIPIENFNQVELKDFGTLMLHQGDQESLTVEADETFIDNIKAEVHQQTLYLGINDDWVGRIGKAFTAIFSSPKPSLTYNLTVRDLSAIRITGKCDLECTSFKTEQLKLKVSGLGNLSIANLVCDDLEVNISGRGDFTAAGHATHHSLKISGSAEVNTPNLISESMNIIITGQGNATVHVLGDLDITISGLGQVNYFGQPKLRQVITGWGRSKRLNEA
jgi:hypothetical protein